jgi:hypothetical protein
LARVVGLYSGETLADLRLLAVSADPELVAVVTDRLTDRRVAKQPLVRQHRVAESARIRDKQ